MRRVFFAIALLCAAPIVSAAVLTNDELSSQPACAVLDSGNPNNDPEIAERIEIVRYACRLPIDDLDAADARAALGDQTIALTRDGDTVTVFARTGGAQPFLVGSLRGNLQRLGQSDFAAARIRLAELDRALISIFLSSSMGDPHPPSAMWRGPQAPAAPVIDQNLAGQIVERTLTSAALGETRKLFIYLPPGHRAGGDYAVVFLSDGSVVNYYAWLIEPLMARGALPPLVLVGSESGQRGIVEDRSVLGDIRALDYLPGWQGDTTRFPAHMRFFSEELVAYAVREFSVTRDARRRVVAGQSNGGAFAFWAAYQHPDVFGNAIVSSQAFRPVDEITPTPVRARFFMNAGLYEQPMLRTTRHTAAALRSQGYEVVFDELAAGHASDQTDVMLIDRLQRIF